MELIRCLIYGVSRFRGKTEEEKKKIAAAAVAVVGSYASERGKKINCRKVILERCACTAHKHALTNPPNVIQRKCFHLVFSFSPPSIFYYEQLYQKPDCSWTETNKAFQDCEGDKKRSGCFFFVSLTERPWKPAAGQLATPPPGCFADLEIKMSIFGSDGKKNGLSACCLLMGFFFSKWLF